MTEHLLDQNLEQYAAGSLSSLEFLSVDDHLAECDQCRNRLARLRNAEARIGSFLAQFQNVSIEHLQYEDLEAYVDHTCDETDREIMGSHLQDCLACTQQVSELQKAVAGGPSFGRKVIFLWNSPRYSSPFRLVAAAAVVACFAFVLALVTGSKDDGGLQARLRMEQQKNLHSQQELKTARQKIAELERATTSEPLVASLRDNAKTVGVTKSGNLLGAQEYSEHYQQLAKLTLQDQRIPLPSWTAKLRGQEVTLMGQNTAQSFHLSQPIGVVVETARPRFTWLPLQPGAQYRVDIFNSQFHRVAASEMLQDTSWTPISDLPRGTTYLWKVTAVVNGKETVSPVPPEPEAKFKVLEEIQLVELNRARTNGSHLWLGLVYADSGMIREARSEFDLLLRENPDSPLAQNLLESLNHKEP